MAINKPILCPVCGHVPVERVLQTVTLLAKIDDQNTAAGVEAYRCLLKGHIFFVRLLDLKLVEIPHSAILRQMG